MLFWIIAIFMCAAGILLVLLPLGRKRADDTWAVNGTEFYRAQLADVERRIAAGEGASTLLEEERAEIGRRLIRADRDGQNSDGKSKSFRVPRTVASLATILAVPSIAFSLYLSEGSVGASDVPLAAQQSRKLENQSVEQLVQKAESHLEKNPDDPRGWEVLARVYERMNRQQDRARAMRQIIRLKGENADRLVELAEALTIAAQNVIPNQAKSLFRRAMTTDPNHRKAQFYFALALEQEGKLEEAKSYWTQLAKLNPENVQWQSLIKARLDFAESGGVVRGPTKEQIEASADLSVEQRTQMIQGMVTGLAERLENEPGDLAGWQRLINAYSVLNKRNEALASLQKAETYFQSQPDVLSKLAELRSQLSLPERKSQ